MQEQHTSNWALILIATIVILFGLFWYIQSQKIDTALPAPISQTPPPKKPAIDAAAELQASVESIVIPDFSEME